MSKVSPSRGATPFDAQSLPRAAEAGDVGGIESLLAMGADVNAASDGGETALMRAASKGRLEAVRLLLDAGANLEARSENGFTALVVAAFFGHAEVVRALLARGASTDAWTRLGASAEDWVRSSGHADIVELLRAPDTARVESPKAKGRTTTRLKKADVTEFFHEGGELQSVVPLAEVNDAQGPPTELSAPHAAEKNEAALIKTNAETDATDAADAEEIEETTLVSARPKREAVLLQPAPHIPARWAAPSSRLFAAMAFGLILGAVAGALAVWQKSRGSAPSRPEVQTVEEVRPATDGDGTPASPTPPTETAPADTAADVEASQIAATISEPETTAPKTAQADEAETAASPSVKPVAPARTPPAPAAAPPPRAAANTETRDKRAPTPAPRKEVAVDESARRVAQSASGTPSVAAKPPTPKPSESSPPVFSPKPGASGERKVIPWP